MRAVGLRLFFVGCFFRLRFRNAVEEETDRSEREVSPVQLSMLSRSVEQEDWTAWDVRERWDDPKLAW